MSIRWASWRGGVAGALAGAIGGAALAQDQLAAYRLRALERDPSAQRVVADCLAIGNCLGIGAPRPVQACAWRMVILVAGETSPDPFDFRGYDRDCGRARLSEKDRALAAREAGELFRSAYGRAFPLARLPPVLR